MFAVRPIYVQDSKMSSESPVTRPRNLRQLALGEISVNPRHGSLAMRTGLLLGQSSCGKFDGKCTEKLLVEV